MSFAGFGMALGNAFKGITDDYDAKQKMQMAQELQDAQIGNLNAQERERQAKAQKDALMQSPEFSQHYQSALTTGNPADVAWIVQRFPQMQAGLIKEPKNQQIINAQEGVFRQGEDGKIYDVATGQPWTGKTIHPVATQPSYMPVQTSAPNAAPQWGAFGSRTGQITPTGVNTVPSGGAGAGKSGQGSQTSLQNIIRLHDGMTAYENNPNNTMTAGQEYYEGLNYGAKKAMIDPSHGVPITTMAGAWGAKALVTPDATAQNYLASVRGMGEDVSQSLKGRTSNDRVIRDIATLGLGSSDWTNATKKAMIQQRRGDFIGMTAIAFPEQFNALPPDKKAIVQRYIDGLPIDVVSELGANPSVSSSGGSAPTSDSKTIRLRDGRTITVP